MKLIPEAPEPRNVLSHDGLNLATYDFSDDQDAPVVFAVHGFASSALGNWNATGWARELTRAGYRLIALDQRGHGNSDKPHDPSMYSMELLVADVLTVLDTYLLDDVDYVGYSLGARVGWHSALEFPTRLRRVVLGGIPDGAALTHFQVDAARSFIDHGEPITDRMTNAYFTMASGVPGNDLTALVALVEGMRDGVQPDLANPPSLPVLFATGAEDPILEKSRALATATPGSEFFEIPGRNHFNAPTSKHFRQRALEFLADGNVSTTVRE